MNLDTLYCSKCGSTDTSSIYWVNNATNEVESIYAPLYDDEYNFCNSCNERRRLMTLPQLWEKFSEIPIDNDDCITEPFMFFEAGTYRFDIWHWFDERCPNGLAKDLNP